jgi:hypothetical protein
MNPTKVSILVSPYLGSPSEQEYSRIVGIFDDPDALESAREFAKEKCIRMYMSPMYSKCVLRIEESQDFVIPENFKMNTILLKMVEFEKYEVFKIKIFGKVFNWELKIPSLL